MFLDVHDEYLGNSAPWGRLEFGEDRISVRELIHERVRSELKRIAEPLPHVVVPAAAETRLNAAPRPRSLLVADDADPSAVKRQFALAEKGFTAGRYFVLLGDRQAEALDEEVDLSSTAEVTFLLLIPLRGG